jgi:plasmid stability protein
VGRGASKPKLVGVYLMPDGHRQLKVEAAKRGATVSDLVREALNAWFANEQLPPLA